MTYVYILAPIALGVIFAICTFGYFVYVRHRKTKLLKRLKQNMIASRCGEAGTISYDYSYKDGDNTVGVYRVSHAPVDLQKSKSNFSQHAESVDTGFYSYRSQHSMDHFDARPQYPNDNSIIEYPIGEVRSPFLPEQRVQSSSAYDYHDGNKQKRIFDNIEERNPASNISRNSRTLDHQSSSLSSNFEGIGQPRPPPLPPPRGHPGHHDLSLALGAYPYNDFQEVSNAYDGLGRKQHYSKRQRPY